MTTTPLSPKRLAEIAKLRDNAIGYHQRAMADLIDEVARLQSAVDRLANAERDLAETQLVLEQQDRDLERLRAEVEILKGTVESGNEAFRSVRETWKRNTDHRDARIAALESGLREACDGWDSLWTSDCNDDPPPTIDRLRALADGVQSSKETT